MAEEVEVESGRKKIKKKKNCTDFHLFPSVFFIRKYKNYISLTIICIYIEIYVRKATSLFTLSLFLSFSLLLSIFLK